MMNCTGFPGWEAYLKTCRKGFTATPLASMLHLKDCKPEALHAVITSSDCGIVRFDGQMQMFGATVCCLRLHTVLLFASHCMNFTFPIMSFA
jgi:hypothetical protein